MKITYSLAELENIAEKLIGVIDENSVCCFHGPMGAGKTTLIKALIKKLGAVDSGSSPTFGLVNEYADAEGNSLAYHFDFYRLEDETEALDMGVEEYFYSGKWVFVEWPEKIPSLLPDNCTQLKLHLIDETTRMVEINNF